MATSEDTTQKPQLVRKEFEMSQAQFDSMIEKINAARQTSGMFLSGGQPMSNPQETANACWIKLGQEMGFDGMTVRPAPGKGQMFFTAMAIDKVEGNG